MRPKQTAELDKEGARELAAKMKEWREEWAAIEKGAEQILKDCDTFGMGTAETGRPEFGEMQKVQQELKE